MIFKDQKPIYTQIADHIMALILLGQILPSDKLSSIREFAQEISVNPNTVVKAYGTLSDYGIIINERGIGFRVADDAVALCKNVQLDTFKSEVLPALFSHMEQLNIDISSLINYYNEYKTK